LRKSQKLPLGQALPQTPQLSGSMSSLTQAPLQQMPVSVWAPPSNAHGRPSPSLTLEQSLGVQKVSVGVFRVASVPGGQGPAQAPKKPQLTPGPQPKPNSHVPPPTQVKPHAAQSLAQTPPQHCP
jgi:hypothetical protein